MSERVFIRTKFIPAGLCAEVRSSVGGFLRYIQHRDHHPGQAVERVRPEVVGLMKYVAYRDGASHRAEFFGPRGNASGAERKDFTAFVTESLEKSRPQLFHGRDGQVHDRRRAVHRMILSPERAEGLNLRKLMLAGVAQLEADCGGSLRWMAAIHRNTDHHHIHFVLAGMRADASGRFVRVDITNRGLAAFKTSVVMEVDRQRGERIPSPLAPEHRTGQVRDGNEVERNRSVPAHTLGQSPRSIRLRLGGFMRHRPSSYAAGVLALRTVARRYQRRMERELEETHRQGGRELVA